MNNRIRHLAVGIMVLFGILFVQLNRWQVVERASLADDPRNNRVTVRTFNAPRGQIVTADGVVIAETVTSDGHDGNRGRFQYQRVYPLGELFANITGYYSLDYGSTQVERKYSDVLSGKTALQQLEATGAMFGEVDSSGSVHLTVRRDLQEVARNALNEREGSVIVLDPRSGAVLAMYSNPTFDPNQIAQHDAGAAAKYLSELDSVKGKPLLANAYQERYMPGSTFKVITTAIGLERGVLSLLSTFPNTSAWTPPNTDNPVQNYGKKTCGGTLTEVFRRSCNIPFAQTAVALGPDAMIAGSRNFGLDNDIPFDLPSPARSTFGGSVESFKDSLALLAIHGFGQGSVQMVPLHMASIAGAIANGGRMMKPFIVADTRTRNGSLITQTQPSIWSTPMLPSTATTLTQLMIEVAKNGTASCCLRLAGGIQVAAKTGTAQLNAEGAKQRSHAWIIAFAPAEAPRVAVAVMLKGVNDTISAGTGGKLAGPIAKVLLDAALTVVQ